MKKTKKRNASLPVRTYLTPTEIKVLTLIAQGKTSKEASDVLVGSKRTIDFHLANMYVTLGVHNRLMAIYEAVKRGFLNPESFLKGVTVPPGIRFTPTEVKVIRLILTLGSSKKVAEKLVVDKRTVDFHLANIYEKLQIRNRIQLLRMVIAYIISRKELAAAQEITPLALPANFIPSEE